MDAFEQLVAELFFTEGYWVQTSVKVELTKEEKRAIGGAQAPLVRCRRRRCDRRSDRFPHNLKAKQFGGGSPLG